MNKLYPNELLLWFLLSETYQLSHYTYTVNYGQVVTVDVLRVDVLAPIVDVPAADEPEDKCIRVRVRVC